MLCYNCFSEFKPHDVWFRCNNTSNTNQTESCQIEEDEKLKIWDPDNAIARHAFPLHGLWASIESLLTNPLHSDCPRCKVRSSRRLCPHCHWELFPEYDKFPKIITSIVGNSRSGKSHFFTVMVQKELPSLAGGGAVIRFADGPSQKIWRDRYYKTLFGDKLIIPPTPKEEREKRRVIYIFSVGERKHANVFFDIAGEHLQDIGIKDVTNETRYLWSSSGIILLINPRDVPDWAPFVEGGPLDGSVPPDDMLGSLIREMRKNQSTGAKGKITTPLAVCISQFDRFEASHASLGLPEELFDPTTSPVRRGQLDMPTLDSESDIVKQFLLDTGGPTGAQIVGLANENFHNVRYFAASALGRSPSVDGAVPDVRANRVAAPMFWLMSQVGAIRK